MSIDQLDGSLNIDVNVSVRTIFSIFKRKSTVNRDYNLAEFLQKGDDLIAVDYVLYGTSTVLVCKMGE